MMPQIELIDLKDKYFRKKMNKPFSDDLIQSITDALVLGEQVIFVSKNRKGILLLVGCITMWACTSTAM
jgi:primosomal protein N' (replication factor Y)